MKAYSKPKMYSRSKNLITFSFMYEFEIVKLKKVQTFKSSVMQTMALHVPNTYSVYTFTLLQLVLSKITVYMHIQKIIVSRAFLTKPVSHNFLNSTRKQA